MLNLFMFFDDAETTTTDWSTWIILGVMLVAVVVMMIVPQRKNKKRAEEMMAKLEVGCTITTIGGIVGELIEMTDTHIWISTGIEGNKQTMQFVRQAIHSIGPVPGSAEAKELEAAEKAADEEIDEIK